MGSYVFRSDGNPSTVSSTIKGSGLQGIIIGMRYASISVVSQISGTRYNAADQFAYKLATTAGTSLAAGATTGTGTSGFTVASVPTIAASYPFAVSQAMVSGSVGTLSNYTTTLSCTNSNAGSTTSLPNNLAASTYTFPNLQYGDAVLVHVHQHAHLQHHLGRGLQRREPQRLAGCERKRPGRFGCVREGRAGVERRLHGAGDAGHRRDAGDGRVTIPSLAQGSYCVILDNNNTLADITSNPPAGWLPTQNSSGVLQVVVPAGAPTPPPQPFGLYNGSRLTGTVFADNGAGAGSANNGGKDGTEAGLGGITVTATASGSAVASAVTTGDGGFTLWVPASVATAVTLAPTAPSGYTVSGGSAGTTGGSYSRPTASYRRRRDRSIRACSSAWWAPARWPRTARRRPRRARWCSTPTRSRRARGAR